jgi:hypothetical protein
LGREDEGVDEVEGEGVVDALICFFFSSYISFRREEGEIFCAQGKWKVKRERGKEGNGGKQDDFSFKKKSEMLDAYTFRISGFFSFLMF